MIVALRHVGVVVSDLDVSIRFYEFLGFIVARRMLERGGYIDALLGMEGAEVTTVKMSCGSGVIELLKFGSHSSGRRNLSDLGYSHIALTVDNLDVWYCKLVGAGIKFNSPPLLSPDGLAKVCFCQDPDGNFVELVEEITYPKAA